MLWKKLQTISLKITGLVIEGKVWLTIFYIKIKQMKLRNITKVAAFALLLSTTVPAFSNNITGDPVRTTKPAKAVDHAKVAEIVKRLDEIKAMDKSALSSSEKKDLRKELKGLKKDMATARGGVYLSIGAIIIVILLLILLL